MRVTFKIKGCEAFSMDVDKLVLGYRRIGIENICGRQSILRKQPTGFVEIELENGTQLVTHGTEFKRTEYVFV